MADLTEKTCCKCGLVKPVGNFYPKKRKSGPNLCSALFASRCKVCERQIRRAYVANNREAVNEKQREHSRSVEAQTKRRAYLNDHPFKDTRNRNEYMKMRRRTNPNVRLAEVLRGRLCAALFVQGARKQKHTLDLLGCSVAECKFYLEGQFQAGMSWDNHGTHGWHVDHIRPLASFDLTDLTQRAEAFHYTNLQPLWATENHRKGGKCA